MMRKLAKVAVMTGILAMAISAPVLADEKNGSATGTEMHAKKTVDVACMASAVDKRETALAAGFDAYAAAVKSAYATRKSALAAAWAMTDAKARNAAIKAAWKGWDGTIKGARKDWRKAKADAWSQFKKDRKACHGTSEDGGGEGHDAEL